MASQLHPQPTGNPGGERSHDLWSHQSALEGWFGRSGGWSSTYMTLSKMMTLLSSVPGDMELSDLMSGAM